MNGNHEVQRNDADTEILADTSNYTMQGKVIFSVINIRLLNYVNITYHIFLT